MHERIFILSGAVHCTGQSIKILIYELCSFVQYFLVVCNAVHATFWFGIEQFLSCAGIWYQMNPVPHLHDMSRNLRQKNGVDLSLKSTTKPVVIFLYILVLD